VQEDEEPQPPLPQPSLPPGAARTAVAAMAVMKMEESILEVMKLFFMEGFQRKQLLNRKPTVVSDR